MVVGGGGGGGGGRARRRAKERSNKTAKKGSDKDETTTTTHKKHDAGRSSYQRALEKQSAARVELLCCGGRCGGHPFVIPVQYRTRVLMLLHFHVTLLFCTDAANGWNKVLVLYRTEYCRSHARLRDTVHRYAIYFRCV